MISSTRRTEQVDNATPMLMTKSGHASIRTLSRYSRPSVDALARWQDQRDPAGRRPPH
jgi:integrase/recombinase XerC/integrase/recombinase XerD